MNRPKRAVSWAFDVSIMLAGAVIGLGALLSLTLGPHLDAHWLTALVVGAPVIVVMSRFPLVLSRSATGIEIGFESAVLVFLAAYHGGEGALAVWAVGQVISQATSGKRPATRLFNMGLGIVAGSTALLVMQAAGPLGVTSPRELGAVALGCAVFFCVDYAMSGVSVALEDQTSVPDALREGSALAALGVFVAIDSLGYLAALVVRHLPGWPGALLVVPLVTILVATRALTRGTEHRRRLQALFDAAADAQVTQSPEALEELLRRSARAAVASGEADLRDEGPQTKEVGARVRTGAGTRWLVAPALDRARATVQADQKAIEALATVGEEAFARLALTKEMGHQARHDALTSLPNRTLFLDRVEQAVSRARRHGMALAVLFLDLDSFKSVNDRFGHAEGDELLKLVAERLLGCVREVDSVARLGGDEFAVLVEGVEGVRELDVLCQRILAALRRAILVQGHEVVVGVSIGVALADPQDEAPALLRNADMAMYRAKALGKDRFYVYQPSLREDNVRRLELVEALRSGIAGDLVVHYQPIVDLALGRVDGLEALVRWARPGGLVAPDTFIRVAEQSGMIVELGERVMATVVADAPRLLATAEHPLSLSCNMSAHQLRDPSFLGLVRDAVAALGEGTLILEMTETVLVADDDETDHALRSLKSLGARLAIDDFGVGFSSIGYLQHLPVEILKIDRSFVVDVDSSPRAAALVDAIHVMGAALGLTVVAEGIERPGQVTRLREAGCGFGQGFLFGRPLPVEEMERFLRSERARTPLAAVHPLPRAAV